MKKTIALWGFLWMAFSVNAQLLKGIEKRHKHSQNADPFSSKRNWADAIWGYHASNCRPLGLHIHPGLTYLVGNSAMEDSAYTLTPSGRIAYHLEIGMEHLFKNYGKIVHYADWGIGIKHFSGREQWTPHSESPRSGTLNAGHLFARIAIHNVWQFSAIHFIDQSIGCNFDYRVYGGDQDTDYTPPNGFVNQGKFVAQLHYSLGIGLKINDGFFLIPTVQTPVLTGVEWAGFNPGHRWFNSRFQPLLFTVKCAWLFRKKGCPKVFDNGRGKQQSQKYQNL